MDPAAVIKKFLGAARRHYLAEVIRLKQEQMEKDPDRQSVSMQKAIEGARWTAFHTDTLLGYLEEKGPQQ